MRRLRLFLCAAAALTMACACAPTDPLTVRTKAGLVRGIDGIDRLDKFAHVTNFVVTPYHKDILRPQRIQGRR